MNQYAQSAKFSDQLSTMPDQMLPRLAQQYKNDAITLSLILSEKNRRERTRGAASAQQAGQPQPKVNDAIVSEVAQALPEDVGIGQLPTPNMDQMYDGGLVSFAGGGAVDRYQVGGVMGDIPGYTPGATPFMPQPGAPEELPLLQRIMAAERERVAKMRAGEAQTRIAQGRGTETDYAIMADAQRKADASAPPTRRADYETPEFAKRMQMGSDVPPAKAPGTVPAPGAMPAPARPAGPGLPGTSDLAKMRQRIAGDQNFQDPAASGLLELESRERASAAAERQAIERDAERFKDVYKGREGRLAEREADIGKQKETNTGLAILNAGLAIMSTPGGLATAIGKGAQVGTAQFAAGLDKIRTAQERLSDARDRLDDLKLNRDETTAKELRAAERDYRNVSINAQKRTIDGIRMAADVNEKRASDIFGKTVDLMKTQYEQGGANSRADATLQATLNSPERQVFAALLKKHGGDAAAAYTEMASAKREPMSVEKLRADWLDTAKRQQIAMDYPNVKTFDDYMTVMNASGAGGAGGFKVVGVR